MTEVDAAMVRIMDALGAGTDPVVSMVALARVLTGHLAALSPTVAEAHRGLDAIAADCRQALVARWPDVELLREPPAGSA